MLDSEVNDIRIFRLSFPESRTAVFLYLACRAGTLDKLETSRVLDMKDYWLSTSSLPPSCLLWLLLLCWLELWSPCTGHFGATVLITIIILTVSDRTILIFEIVAQCLIYLHTHRSSELLSIKTHHTELIVNLICPNFCDGHSCDKYKVL